jgi:hypothetical protein
MTYISRLPSIIRFISFLTTSTRSCPQWLSPVAAIPLMIALSLGADHETKNIAGGKLSVKPNHFLPLLILCCDCAVQRLKESKQVELLTAALHNITSESLVNPPFRARLMNSANGEVKETLLRMLNGLNEYMMSTSRTDNESCEDRTLDKMLIIANYPKENDEEVATTVSKEKSAAFMKYLMLRRRVKLLRSVLEGTADSKVD